MTTPMFEQFHALKAQAPDAILFFRMGDFYETFFEDAVVAAEVLELTLTSRNKDDPEPIPMAGVPHHAAGAYVQRLVDAGHKVAIAEQVEDPAEAKGLVRRELVRVVTPGIVLDPGALDARAPNWLAAVHVSRGAWGLAVLDVSTGDLRQCDASALAVVVDELSRLEPREVLVSPTVAGDDRAVLDDVLRRGGVVLSEVDEGAWASAEAWRTLTETLGVADLAGFGARRGGVGVSAAGAVVRYARGSMRAPLGNVHRLRTWTPGGFMVLDEATRRNLEITRTMLGGRRAGSLLGLLDRTRTAMGGRMLREWVGAPLRDPAGIAARHDAVAALVDASDALAALRDVLRTVSDLERLGARVAQGTANARDLVALGRSLGAIPGLHAATAPVPAVARLLPADPLADVAADIGRWLVDEPPPTTTEGGMIREGADPGLDAIIRDALDGHGILARLEADEREATGITSLRIKHNKVFGYFFEVTRANAHRVPDRFLRKQTLTGAERFITPELKELEDRVLGADERRRALEHRLFMALRDRVALALPRLGVAARRIAGVDALGALAEAAVRLDWTRPTLSEQGVLEVDGGRHPVVEASVEPGTYVANDLRLDVASRRLVVLTGPNMAGKSTVLRMAALIVLLAQVGSFVPARRAVIGLADRIFTRVGAADDLSAGRSTFMVEMAETASILHHATAHSLVVLDEIGRGTSTYDGLAIAWAVAEDLVDRVGCRALFATHYHELCELGDTRPTVANQSVAVRASGEQILFLRTLVEGGASRSYGIACARLAGLPRPVVERAKTLLTHFEKHAPRNDAHQLSLFGATPATPPATVDEPAPDPAAERVITALRALDPDALSPRDAHAALYRLRALAEGSGGA